MCMWHLPPPRHTHSTLHPHAPSLCPHWWGCGWPPVVPPPIRAFMWEGLWPPKCAWVPPTIISPSLWALTQTLNLALMPLPPFPRYISHEATQPHLGAGAWGYKPPSWHPGLWAQRLVIPMAYAFPLPCPRLGRMGGGGAKGSGGGDVTGGHGGCTGAVVGTPCPTRVIYIAGRPLSWGFWECPYLIQIRCGRDSMASQSSPYYLTFPGLPFEEDTLDWGAVCLCL